MSGYSQGLQNIVSGLQDFQARSDRGKAKEEMTAQKLEAQNLTKRQRAMQFAQQGLDPNQALAIAEYEQTGIETPESSAALQTFSDYAKQKRQAAMQRPGAEFKPSETQKTFEREAGKKLAEYQLGGGKEEIDKNISRFEGAIQRLEEPDELTGGFATKIPFLGTSEGFQDIVDEDLSSVRDEIRSAIQGSLRPILGAQFTEKEAQQIFSRAFNPRLSDKENIKRARLELENLKNIAGAKEDAWEYYQSKGSLAGFTPSKGRKKQMVANNDDQRRREFTQNLVNLPGVDNIQSNVPIQNQIIPSATASEMPNFVESFRNPEGVNAIKQELRRRRLKK